MADNSNQFLYGFEEVIKDPAKIGKVKPKPSKPKPQKKPVTPRLKNALEIEAERTAKMSADRESREKENARALKEPYVSAQSARGGKSLAQLQSETPGTYNYEVQRARQILGIKEGSDDDKALKSAMWSAINQLPDDQDYYKRIDKIESLKVIKEFQSYNRAKTEEERQKAANVISNRIRNAQLANERNRNLNLPTIAESGEEQIKLGKKREIESKFEILGSGNTFEENKQYVDNLINSFVDTAPNHPASKFVANIVGETLLSPFRAAESFAYAGLAGQNQDVYNPADVAGSLASGIGNLLLTETGAAAVAPALARLKPVADVIAKFNKVDLSESKNFVRVVQSLKEGGVDDAYKVAKSLREAARSGVIDDVGKAVDDTIEGLGKEAQRLDSRGKPIVRVMADSREVDVPNVVEPTIQPPEKTGDMPSAPQIQKSAPRVEPSVVNKPSVDAPKSTGLANQVQDREAIDGIISRIDSVKGKSAEEWQQIGKKSGITLDSASKLAQDIATGNVNLTGENIGKLLEGKRLKLNEIADLRVKAANEPKKYAEKLFDAEAELQQYLDNIQVGKGQWSDIGRALQAGTSLDYGNFEDVLLRAKSTGRAVEEGLRKQLKESSDAWAKAESNYQAKIKELQAEKARNAVITTRRSAKPAKVAAIKQERAELLDQFRNLRNSSGVGGNKRRGAASIITAEDIRVAKDQVILLKRIAETVIREGAVHLEDVVLKVRAAFRESLDTDIEDQAIIDALATADDAPTKTEIGERLKSLKKEAKGLSTPKREADAAKAKAAKEAKAAREKLQAAKRREAQMRAMEKRHLAEAERAEREIERIRLREQAKAAAEQAKKEKRIADTISKQAEKEFGEQWKREERLFQATEKANDLEKQLREGRYRIEQPKSVKEKRIDAEIADALARKRVAQKNIDIAIRNQYRSKTEKAVTGLLDFARASQLGADVGVLTRQGLFSLVRGKSYLKALVNAGKVTFSEVNLAKVENEIEDAIFNGRKLAPIRQKAGLDLTTGLTAAEELSFSRLIKNLPIIGDKIGGGLERFQSAFINTVRADVFDQAVRKGFSEDELKLRAQFINNATGRGNIKNVPKKLQVIMTSPRYESSRWAMLGEPFKNAGILGYDAFVNKKINRAAVENIKDLAGTAAVVFSALKLSEAAGYELNFDPTSSDFLKMRKGDEVWDVTAGISPRLRDIVRLVVSFSPDFMNTYPDIIGKAGGRTINPAISTPADMISQEFQKRALGRLPEKELQSYLKSKGRPETKKGSGIYKRSDKKGDPKKLLSLQGFTVDEGEAQGMLQLAPLIIQSFYQTYNEEGPISAAGAATKEAIGGSVGRYPKNDSPTQLQTLLKEISNKQKRSDK